MDINKFLTNNLNSIKHIISGMNQVFNSHDFLQKFSKKFESDYIEMLYYYRSSNAFRTVHSLIAKFLSENANFLCISKTKKVKSKNIFGEFDEIQEWKK